MKKTIFIVVNEDVNAPKYEKKFTTKDYSKCTVPIIKNYVFMDNLRLVK